MKISTGSYREKKIWHSINKIMLISKKNTHNIQTNRLPYTDSFHLTILDALYLKYSILLGGFVMKLIN